MSRVIKFRAWDKEQNKMLNWKELELFLVCELFNNNELIKMQFTGLHDKNGKEIYEGDLLKYYYSTEEVRFGIFDNGERYEDNCQGCGFYLYHMAMKNISYLTEGYAKNSQIVGNIYENPELLPKPPETEG